MVPSCAASYPPPSVGSITTVLSNTSAAFAPLIRTVYFVVVPKGTNVKVWLGCDVKITELVNLGTKGTEQEMDFHSRAFFLLRLQIR